MINEYYLLTYKDTRGSSVLACTEGRTKLAHEIIPDIILKNEFLFKLDLKKVTIIRQKLQVSDDLSDLKDVWLDYLPNDLAFPLMSEKMKDVIISHLTGKEGITWIKVLVNGNGEIKNYYLPRFLQKLDVFDSQKTLFSEDSSRVLQPVFSISKIINYTIFHNSSEFYWEISRGLYLNKTLKKAFQKEKLTGVEFEKTSVY